MINVSASLRFLRMSPRKVRLILDAVRGKDAVRAEEMLKFSNKLAAKPILKLLRSALANAKVKKVEGALFITKAFVDQGPTLKRYRPRAFGSSAPILKRSSHITIELGQKSGKEKT